jgi:hypothetical protein
VQVVFAAQQGQDLRMGVFGVVGGAACGCVLEGGT